MCFGGLEGSSLQAHKILFRPPYRPLLLVFKFNLLLFSTLMYVFIM
nr:MAG TPA: hypothetical protein [Caudoviricetes sp.]